MIKLIYIIPVMLVVSPVFLPAQKMSFEENVLENLYKANGNQIVSKPKLKIVEDTKNAAQFLGRTKVIVLSKKLVDLCKGYGKDSSAALALFVGHELAHAYQLDLLAGETSYLAYDKAEGTDTHHEEAADVAGGFMAYLAGYNTLDLIEPIMVKLYAEFNLKNELKGYPSLEERKKTAVKVRNKLDELIQLFEAANMLTAIGEYKKALDCYKYIEQWYKGREIYNNIAVNYCLLAMHVGDRNADQYIYPIELDWGTRMKKPMKSRGEILTGTEAILRMEYLKKSEENLKVATFMDQDFFTADLNLMCVYILADKSKEAIKAINKNSDARRNYLPEMDPRKSDQLNLALALAYAAEGQTEKARKIWIGIANRNTGILSQQAKANLEILDGRKLKAAELEEVCIKFSDSYKPVDGIKIHRVSQGETWLNINKEEGVEVCIQELEHSSLYTFRTADGYFSMQRVAEAKKFNSKSLLHARASLVTNKGFIYHCESDKYALLIGDDGKMKEWVKYN